MTAAYNRVGQHKCKRKMISSFKYYIHFGLLISCLNGIFCQNTTSSDKDKYDDVPKVVISVVLLATALVLGVLIAKLVDYIHDRRTLRDDASDMSDHTKELLRRRYVVAMFLAAAKKEGEPEEQDVEPALKAAKLWRAKVALSKKRGKSDVALGITDVTDSDEASNSVAEVHNSGFVGSKASPETASIFTVSETKKATDNKLAALQSNSSTVTENPLAQKKDANHDRTRAMDISTEISNNSGSSKTNQNIEQSSNNTISPDATASNPESNKHAISQEGRTTVSGSLKANPTSNKIVVNTNNSARPKPSKPNEPNKSAGQGQRTTATSMSNRPATAAARQGGKRPSNMKRT